MAKKQNNKQREQPLNENLPVINGPRLPYHPGIEQRFDIDQTQWKALVEAVFPNATTVESVILALAYCKARGLDPFKKNIHIVPIWDKDKGQYIDTVWPGIGELRTTAHRTKAYAGREMTTFGPDQTRTWERDKYGEITITFPEWAQVTVYRMIQGEKVAFAGPPVYWLETYASVKDGSPNSMWQKRPRGQLDKCAEAAALRAAFPEEIGDQPISDEGGMIYQHGSTPIGALPELPQSGVEKAKAVLGAGEECLLDDEPDPDFKAKAAAQAKKLREAEAEKGKPSEDSALGGNYVCSRCGVVFDAIPECGNCSDCHGQLNTLVA